jgi:hypothetical protein
VASARNSCTSSRSRPAITILRELGELPAHLAYNLRADQSGAAEYEYYFILCHATFCLHGYQIGYAILGDMGFQSPFPGIAMDFVRNVERKHDKAKSCNRISLTLQ